MNDRVTNQNSFAEASSALKLRNYVQWHRGKVGVWVSYSRFEFKSVLNRRD